MIDNGSALNVSLVSTLKQMNVDLNHIRSSKTTVQGFDGSRREVNGEIGLLINIGPCSFSVTFQVLDIPNAFSLLLGRPWIHLAGAVPSALHQRLKFIAEEWLITIKGEEDYAIYKETIVPYISIGDDENLPFHSFETISVIRDYGEIIEAHIGKHLHRLAAHYGKINRGIPVPSLSHFFPAPPHIIGGTLDGPFSNSDDAPVDLPAICAITEETLSRVYIALRKRMRSSTTGPQSRATRLLYSNPNLQHGDLNPSEELIEELRPIYFEEGLDKDGREEVVKQINTGFLEVCNHSEWVGNIVPVEKKDGRVRVCINYRDLNKASPKDNFPLPHIDVLVDNTACYMLFSFMDGFSGYNQIRMADEDKINTTFITMWGTFCYREYKLRLNPAKCTFGAKSGKLLGFVVSEHGIEVDPDKVKAIMELPPPSTVREVRGFLGWLNYIARFIANLKDKCRPLFHLLRKNAAIKWEEECQKAFDTIKAFLVQLPVLVPLIPDRPLVLYLTVCQQSLGCMLGQEDESMHAEHAIYYLSKKFTEGESNYPKIEKMCYALVWVM
ncbi:hypothetical protein CRG98_008738 [Punica granatum]|uniref:Reverse transcriptase/retrotransposon-derived protein RNase H-like domain-containing protein n=1 Tax=Punica granatum TaxID=22663 RepID=A0A2I0KQU6_PUNGR|nr:hypothetical protein CRG98_008738 [Punica granatum]